MITKFKTRLDLIRSLPPKAVIAEVGVWRGYFSIEMLNHANLGLLYLVDAWKNQPGYNDPLTDANHEANMAETQKTIRGHIPGGRVQIIRGTSTDVATNDRLMLPLDAVYIDADHSYDAVMRDLCAWEPRLKPTGVILGHDYTDNDQAKKWGFGVIRAVHDFCKLYGWELTGLTEEDFASFRLERLKTVPRIVHQIHFGEPCDNQTRHLIDTVLIRNPNMRHTLWNEGMLMEIGIDVSALASKFPTHAGVSNAARLLVIQKFGGIYLDTDVECLQPLDELTQVAAFGALQDEHRICNAVFGACAYHPWINWQVERMNEYGGADPTWGVELMSRASREGVTLIAPGLVYPWFWHTPKDERKTDSKTLTIHYWKGSWK